MTYSEWLEEPYQTRYAQDEDFERFVEYCEENDLDAESEDFETWLSNDREDRKAESADIF